MKLRNKIELEGRACLERCNSQAFQKEGRNRIWSLPLVTLIFGVVIFVLSNTSFAQTVYIGQSPFLTGGSVDKYPVLVILGEFNSAGPSANSLDVTPSGMVQDVKVAGASYDFTLYALAWVTNGASPGEQIFQVVSSQHVSGGSGELTVPVRNFVVNSGNLLAFAGIGPFDIRDTNGLDATYGSVSNIDKTTLSGVPGTTFSVANDGTPGAEYEYLSPASRTYDIGVDILVTNGCYSFFTIAGQGTNGGADGFGTNASFNDPQGIAFGTNFDLFVSDTYNNRIRKITSLGTNWLVTTVAGSMANSYGSADGAGTNASFSDPTSVAVTSNETVFVADTLNSTIRMITPISNNWMVSTIAGLAGYSGTNDGSNSVARFWFPEGIAVDSRTNVYVSDTFNDTIRKMTLVNTNWVVTTIAGLAGFSGSASGTNSAARFDLPQGLAVDNAGNLYVADSLNNMVRKLTQVGTNWVSSTIAGTNSSGSDDGTNGVARFNTPEGIAVDASNNLYVADTGNNTVREIIPLGTDWSVSTIGGQAGAPPDYADGTGPSARFTGDKGVAVLEDFISLAGPLTQLGNVTTNVYGTIQPGGYTVEVAISPNSAILDGAMWGLAGFPFTASGKLQHTNTTSGALTLVFSNIPGWTPPSGSFSTSLNPASQVAFFNISYTPMSPSLNLSKANGLWINGASNTTFEIDWTNILTTNATWPPLQLPGAAGNVRLYPGTSQQVANWHDLTNANLKAGPVFYRAKWTGQ